MHAYSEAQYRAAIAKFSETENVPADQMPPSLRYCGVARHFAGGSDGLAAAWSSLSLEDKISKLAMRVGSYWRGDASSPWHVVTYGYEMLCRSGRLTV